MNTKIVGSGAINSGEYENIIIRGRGKLCGKVKCASFSSAGSVSGESVECSGDFKASGSTKFSGSLAAVNVKMKGKFSANGKITAEDNVTAYGKLKCADSIKANAMRAFGAIKVEKDVEGENVEINGSLNCNGLVNAETFTLRSDARSRIGCVGGGSITIKTKGIRKFLSMIPLLSRILKPLSVESYIEGEEIFVESLSCPKIIGSHVVIGKGCKIGLVQYTDKIEISPKAKAERVEKIS